MLKWFQFSLASRVCPRLPISQANSCSKQYCALLQGRWVKIKITPASERSIGFKNFLMISVTLFLQSIVEEMLRLKNGGNLRKAGEKNSTRDYNFKRADGSEMTIPVRTSGCSRIELPNYTKKVGLPK